MNTVSWLKRAETHRYSQDDRMLSYKFGQELAPKINSFLDDAKSKELVLGTYNLTKEPWKLIAINEFRKFGVKIIEKSIETVDGEIVTITLVKKPMQATR